MCLMDHRTFVLLSARLSDACACLENYAYTVADLDTGEAAPAN